MIPLALLRNGAVIKPIALAVGGAVLQALAYADAAGHVHTAVAHPQINYAQLEAQLDEAEAVSLTALIAAVTTIRDGLITRVKRNEPRPKDLELPGLPALREAVRGMLHRAWALGGKDARGEVQAMGRAYAAPYTPKSAASWLVEKVFWVTDLLAGHLLDDVRGMLVNALKTGEALSVTIEKLWQAFTPYIGDPDVLRDGEPLPPSRLETIVRTNTTDAYNHGRLTEFIKPDVLPFVDGIRYSAIMDSRTTPVCQFLDGKVFLPMSPDLAALIPPNHFNCRSILVPIVVGQKIDKADFITPAEVGRARELADAKFLAQWDEIKHPRNPSGTGTGGQWTSSRTARAIASYIPATKEKQLKAAKFEASVARIIKGKNLDDHEPFDVIRGRHAVEVKAIVGGKNPKITMHPESLARKVSYLRREKSKGHTVVIDVRGSRPIYYYRAGVGSFRLSAMRAVTRVELAKVLR